MKKIFLLGLMISLTSLTIFAESSDLRGTKPSITKNCISDVCVGNIVYKGDEYSEGAKVVGLDRYTDKAIVQSMKSGQLFTEDVEDLFITEGCIDDICVGNIVNKGSIYSKGAEVVGLNRYTDQVTVRSINNGRLYTEYL